MINKSKIGEWHYPQWECILVPIDAASNHVDLDTDYYFADYKKKTPN